MTESVICVMSDRHFEPVDVVEQVLRTHVAPVTGLEEEVALILHRRLRSIADTGGAMAQTNIELTRDAYDAINRRDVEWLIARVDPDVEMHMFGIAGVPVVYRGAAGIREYFRDMDELWASYEATPEEIRDLGDRVFVIGRQRFRGRASGIEVEERAALVFHLRDGLVTEMRAYESVEDGLAAAGLE